MKTGTTIERYIEAGKQDIAEVAEAFRKEAEHLEAMAARGVKEVEVRLRDYALEFPAILIRHQAPQPTTAVVATQFQNALTEPPAPTDPPA